MTRGLSLRVAAVLGACVSLAGCETVETPIDGDVRITPAAIAAIMKEHLDLGEPDRVLENRSYKRELGSDSRAAWVWYADVSVVVGVAATSDDSTACTEHSSYGECVDDSIDGHDVTLAWQEAVPEEDAGYVLVIDRRDGEEVTVYVSPATEVTGDPRNLDIGVPLADLAALATDPRLSLTTSQAVIDLGADVHVEHHRR